MGQTGFLGVVIGRFASLFSQGLMPLSIVAGMWLLISCGEITTPRDKVHQALGIIILGIGLGLLGVRLAGYGLGR